MKKKNNTLNKYYDYLSNFTITWLLFGTLFRLKLLIIGNWFYMKYQMVKQIPNKF